MKVFTKLFKKKTVEITFCTKNLDRFLTEESFKLYQSFLIEKQIRYKEYVCQSRCEQCKNKPYALLNGEFVTGENALDLLHKLEEKC